ncbi:Med18 protein [Geosmithia morbida]|uniref:Mediator of RNA polymerase II transcription subunit 18 n=1 Tax=Geosmithia morbida TaxID=1094350 RepID=A0A9P4YUN7_9HYPO|nr:Med18 protein [Geosmithia morbida]KAF4122021.1 Med18 protein [Geosmithia morbida]
MYELFLTALVEADDFNAACSVLGGLCGMPPWESVMRVLYFQAPPQPPGFANHSSLDKPIRKDTAFLLKELHQNLSRLPFILQTRYEVDKDRAMGESAAPADLNSLPGMLRWTNLPDPPQGRPHLTQRKMVEVWEQKNLQTLMSDNNYEVLELFGLIRLTETWHSFKTEMVEDMYRFYRDHIEFCLYRQLFVRPISDYVPMETRTTPPSPPLERLPAFDSLTPVDAQGRWILLVKTHVLNDNRPEDLRKAHEELNAIRSELDGVFDFRSIDRNVHDPRVPRRQQGVQVLPQKVTLGKV